MEFTPQVFACSSDPSALEQAQIHYNGSKVIPGMPQSATQTHQGHSPLDSAMPVEGFSLEDGLIELGLSVGQSRMFADALRSGSSVLIIEGNAKELNEPLIEAGAGYVSDGQ